MIFFVVFLIFSILLLIALVDDLGINFTREDKELSKLKKELKVKEDLLRLNEKKHDLENAIRFIDESMRKRY